MKLRNFVDNWKGNNWFVHLSFTFINQSWQNLIIHNLYTANVSSLVRDGVQDVREIQSFISKCTTIHFFHGNKFCIKVHCLFEFHKKLGCWLWLSKGETEHISKTIYSWECTNHVLQLPDMDELFFVKRSYYISSRLKLMQVTGVAKQL